MDVCNAMKLNIKNSHFSIYFFLRNECNAEYNYFNYFQKRGMYAKTFQLTFFNENNFNDYQIK